MAAEPSERVNMKSPPDVIASANARGNLQSLSPLAKRDGGDGGGAVREGEYEISARRHCERKCAWQSPKTSLNPLFLNHYHRIKHLCSRLIFPLKTEFINKQLIF